MQFSLKPSLQCSELGMDLFKQKSSKGSAVSLRVYRSFIHINLLCEKTNMLHETQIRPLHRSENLIPTIYHRLRIGLRMYYWQYPAGRIYMQNWVISTALDSDYVDKCNNLSRIPESRSFPKSHIWNDFNIVAYLINYCSCPTNHLS